jgi:hypothetical protein
MGVISEADKKVLLERLVKAREAKAAKKKATAPVPVPVHVPDVAPPPEPAPLSVAAPAEIAPPPVPDLVAAAKKKPKQKKVKLPESSSDSDSDDEPVLPPKKNKGENKRSAGVPYMKIKIYKDSPKALESIMQTIQDNQEEEEPKPSEPIPIPVAKPRTVCMTGARPSTNTQALRAGTSLRDAALAVFS